MHSYTVELRIISDKEKLDLNAITESLGIAPNNTHQIGESKSPTRVWNSSMWGYSVYPEYGEQDWESMEDALDALLKLFMPLKEKIWGYGEIYHVVIWSGHFSSSIDGGPTFSPRLLQDLGEFGVELFIDTYCCEDPTSTQEGEG